jgi:Tfp pilus assembly protein PilZ
VQAGWQRYATVENIGLGGACVVFDERVAAGDAVTVSVTAPTLWDPLVLRARVAWVAPAATSQPPYRAGLAFEHKTAPAAFALYELIATLAYE